MLGPFPGEPESDADQAITAMYSTQYRPLVRMAAVLVGDVSAAEEVVQDSFIAMHGAWRRLRDIDKALNYLCRSVVNQSRSVLRRRMAAGDPDPDPKPDSQPDPKPDSQPDPRRGPNPRPNPGPEREATARVESSAVISALSLLPPMQREALVLKFYLDLSESQVASVLGISQRALKSHTALARAALQSILELET